MDSTFVGRSTKHDCAAYAYSCISDILANLKDCQDKYRSEVMSTGTRIHEAGLMQTLAFYCSKMKEDSSPHFQRLALHLMKWILRGAEVKGRAVDTSRWDDDRQRTLSLFEVLLEQRDESMMLLTADAKEVAQWLKRFADARLEGTVVKR
ncbi:MAG: type III-B CRISPR module-associated protein Cmr5 [Candidatus Thorarchaeota archaeon]